MIGDLKFALRMLVKAPGFAATAILTLAIGIGANTAIFSVVDAVLLRALPYHNSARLIDIFSTDPNGERDALSTPEFRALQAQMRSLEDIAGFQSQSVNVTGGERPDRVRGSFVSANFFRVFNLTPLLGRTLAEGEDQPGAERVAVVNEKIWRERLGGDPQLENKRLILNGEPYNVVGVIPSSFKSPFDPDVEVWLSMANYPGNTSQQDSRFMIPLGHLKPGVPLEQAQAEANTIATELAAAFPKENAGRGIKVDYFQDFLVRDTRPMLWLLFSAAGVILLIACANLANLLLARGLARQREIALRAALGASRARLVRQVLMESALLALLGGFAGVLVAHWSLWALLQIPQSFVNAQTATINTPVLFFAVGASLVVGLVFGLVPALQLSRTELQSGLRQGERSSDGGRWNGIRGTSVAGQIALSVLLLIGCGLLIRSFENLLRADVGFDAKNLLTLEYRLPRIKYQSAESQWNFHRQALDQIRQIPGVKSVGLIRSLPFSGNGGSGGIALLDRETPVKGHEPHVQYNLVTPALFETMRIPLLRGRVFRDDDRATTPLVFVINKTMAQRFWPNSDPVGKQVRFLDDNVVGTIVGVVGDTKQYQLTDDAVPQMYAAYAQQPGLFATLVARTDVPPLTLAEQVRGAIWRVDPDQPMWKIRTVEFLVERRMADRKFALALMSVFATLALLLTALGLYGVISYFVNQRTREIGIRMALGAQMRHVLNLILRQGVTLVVVGSTFGLIGALALTRLMSHLLVGVSPTDPLTFTAMIFLLAAVSILACYLPARRAARIDPVIALRSE
ncbi:MAG: ABC transporter permease [Candidatus Udaeobacter sp.]